MTDMNTTDVIAKLYEVINDRKMNPAEGSYTCYLFEKGIDKILKKLARNAPRPSSPQKMLRSAATTKS